MKSLRAVGAIGAAGLGSVAHAIAICDCSVLDCYVDAVPNEEICVSVLLDYTVLNELAHGVPDIYTDSGLLLNEHADPSILRDSFGLEFSQELGPGVDVGFDFYFELATRSALKSFRMDLVFDSMADINSLQKYLEPEYVRRAPMGRGIDFKLLTAANMFAWVVAGLSSSVRLPAWTKSSQA